MNKRNKIIVSIVGITIVLLALLGITYAYYLTRIQGNTNTNSISVTTAKLELVYGDGNAEILTGSGTLTPSTDLTSTGAIGTKDFTVTNNGNDSSYVVIIDNVSTKIAGTNTDTTFLSNDFRYTLSCTKSDGTKCNDVSDLTIFPINGGILVSNDIKAEDVHTYTLTMWYIDTGIDQSDDMGKSYQARVNIADVAQMENPFKTGVTATDNANLAYNIIKNAKENKNGTELTNTPLTNPAAEISKFLYKTHEAEIAPTESSVSINTTYQSSYWTYATDYIVDETTGKFSLVDPKVCLYNDTDLTDNTEIECDELISTMVLNGETIYILSTSASLNTNTSATLKTTTNLSNIYLVTTAPVSSTSTITMKVKKVTSISYSLENYLSLTTDDYGTSYYYRGGVTDNYVNFAGMCWRIVRIAGDGTIKLILEDQYTTCNDTETETTTAVYTGNWNIGTGNYGYDSSSKSTSGSTLQKKNYLNPVTDNTLSMVKAFYDFQTTKLADYTGKLKSGDWCLGDKTYTRSGSSGSYTYTLLEDTSSNYLSKTSFYYDAYTRLRSGNANGYQPTLKCNGTILNEFADVSGVSSKSPMYVSAITADEIAYAGGKAYEGNSNYYLMNDYSRNSYKFWSLSPEYFIGDVEFAFYVNNDGKLYGSGVGNDYAFRPSVNLSSSAVISGGEGTLEKPYVIG